VRNPVKTGFVIFAHGSRLEPANETVRIVAADMARRGGYELVETAFLDLAHPTLSEAVGKIVSQGAARVVVIPYFLVQGTHLQRDLRQLVEEILVSRPHLEILVTEPLDGHPCLSQILLDRARASLEERASLPDRSET